MAQWQSTCQRAQTLGLNPSTQKKREEGEEEGGAESREETTMVVCKTF